MKQLASHIPHAVQKATDLGLIDESKEMPVTVALELSDEDGLKRALSDMYDPSSPKYRQFLTPEEFRARFGPTLDQIAQVEDYLQGQGLHSISVDPNGLSIHAIGKASVLNAAFHTEVHQYAGPKGKTYHAPSAELSVPDGLPIQGVLGLTDLTMAHTHAKMAAPQGSGLKDSVSPHASGSGPQSGLSPTDIRTAYNTPANLDGSGQSIAIFELDGYTESDITAYEQQFNLPAVSLQNILVDNAPGTGGDQGSGEVTLDIELAMAVAPNVSKIYVYEGPNTEQGMLDTYSKIAADNLAKQVSTSWGAPEAQASQAFLQSENTTFMQMAAQGQTIYAAAGDNGAYDDGSNLGVDDPSSQPYVVGVGGTTLTLASNDGYGSETTWNDQTGAGGGGVSASWTIPTWQQGLTPAGASTTMRNTPDVSLHADIATGYAIYFNGSWGVWGGTSCAAPIWTAFTALVNQSRTSQGLASLGYVTPALYALGKSARYHDDFNDIADGSTNKYYKAAAGYDNATGWGSFNGASLADDLVQAVPGGAAGSTLSCASP